MFDLDPQRCVDPRKCNQLLLKGQAGLHWGNNNFNVVN